MFRIAICDEDPYAADHIESLLRESGQAAAHHPVLKFFDPFALARYIEQIKGQLDILLLAIADDQGNGIEAAERISGQYPHIKIIFITGYIEYASTMMDANPAYFLTKPIEAAALTKAMEATKNALLRDPSQIITINIRGYMLNISSRDTLYIASSKRIVTIYGYSDRRIIHAKLKELAGYLPPVFCYCHRDFIVNLDKTKSMDKKSFHLITGQRIPIGQTKYERAKEEFRAYRNP